MRIKLTIQQLKKSQMIPINYQYPLSVFIYKTIESADPEHADWLHKNGFSNGNKKFKLFTFSKLSIPEFRIIGNKIILESGRLHLIISMLIENTIESFMVGIFTNQKFRIFDTITAADFVIKFVEIVPEPEFTETMKFHTLSPIVLTKKIDNNGYKFLNPEDDEYPVYLRNNLLEKYRAYCATRNISEQDYKIDEIKILSKPKQKLFKIKEGTPEENDIKAHYYDFEMKGSPKLLKFGYEAGFGKDCSLGFGCVKAIEN